MWSSSTNSSQRIKRTPDLGRAKAAKPILDLFRLMRDFTTAWISQLFNSHIKARSWEAATIVVTYNYFQDTVLEMQVNKILVSRGPALTSCQRSIYPSSRQFGALFSVKPAAFDVGQAQTHDEAPQGHTRYISTAC